jgi:hypothetical protein
VTRRLFGVSCAGNLCGLGAEPLVAGPLTGGFASDCLHIPLGIHRRT